jgi:hypothetical protein
MLWPLLLSAVSPEELPVIIFPVAFAVPKYVFRVVPNAISITLELSAAPAVPLKVNLAPGLAVPIPTLPF